MQLTTHSHLVLRSKICGLISPLPHNGTHKTSTPYIIKSDKLVPKAMLYEINTERTSVKNQNNCHAKNSWASEHMQHVTSCNEYYSCVLLTPGRQKTLILIVVLTSVTLHRQTSSIISKLSFTK